MASVVQSATGPMANQSLLREFFKYQAVPATLLKAAGSWAHKQDVIESWLHPSHWVRCHAR
jgi:hypothetical protein